MASRGRKSAASLAVVKDIPTPDRPAPPAHLNARQAEIWQDTVSSEADKLFSTAVLKGLLADYCMRREASELISEIISTFNPDLIKSADGAKRYKELLQMRDLEVRGSTQIATKLRLTNQSRYTPQAAATAAKSSGVGTRPWEK